ncbi:MAG: alpha/beta hydrolase [Deltaproteobacteria bacterium]
MRQPLFRNIFKILPLALLLVGVAGCLQSGFAQSRAPGGPALAGSQPVVVENVRGDGKSRLFGIRTSVPAAQASQAMPSESPDPAQLPQSQPVPPQPTSPQTSVVPRGLMCDGDYWIVSSRHCDSRHAPCDADCCLSYFHCPPDRSFCPQTRETFLASVRPDRPVCFVAHGSYNWWGDAMAESRLIHRWIRSAAPQSRIQVVIFTWPSDGNMPYIFPVDIAILGRKSAAHGTYLASLITHLPGEQKVSIVGHSHGARTAVAALHVLGGGVLEGGQALPPGYAVPQHLRAVLLAAAIDHHWLNPGDRYGQALMVPERVLLMRNSRDATLGIYPLRKGLGERALGRGGLGPDDRLVLGSLGPKVVEMDVAGFADWHHGFAHYHEQPALAAAMVPFVYFQDDAPAALGPLPGPPALTPTPATPPAKFMPEAPAVKESTTAKPKARELWVDQPAASEPRRNAVELGFEK